MDTKEVTRALETLGQDWEEYKTSNDKRLKAIEQNGGIAEVTGKLETIDAAIDAAVKLNTEFAVEQKSLQDRLDEAEARLEMGGPQTRADEIEQEEQKHLDLFEKAVRSNNFHGQEAQELHNFCKEAKAVDTLTGAAGGFAVPEVISRDIADQERLLSPVRGLVKVVPIGTSDYKELVNIHGETSGWAGEGDTRTDKATPALRERAPTMGTLYAYPKATEESMDDMFFNVQAWLTDAAAVEFASAEGIAVISGDGTNKPTGLLDTAPVTTDDDASPPRAAGALEYTPLDTASPLTAIGTDELITLVYLLRSPYRAGSTWTFNSNTTAIVRKLKDTTNQYLWAPGLVAGQPAFLLGYPVSTWEDMDDAAIVSPPNNHPIMFGNFRRGYLLVDRVGLRVTPDPLTTPGQVKFYIRRREGGIILDNNAIKVGKFDTS